MSCHGSKVAVGPGQARPGAGGAWRGAWGGWTIRFCGKVIGVLLLPPQCPLPMAWPHSHLAALAGHPVECRKKMKYVTYCGIEAISLFPHDFEVFSHYFHIMLLFTCFSSHAHIISHFLYLPIRITLTFFSFIYFQGSQTCGYTFF